MGTTGVKIRKARMDDIDSIKSLADANKSALGFVLRPVLANGIQMNRVLVAERAGKLIGFIHFRHRQDKQTTIYEICVDEYWRKNGIGRLLIETLIAESHDLGYERVLLKAPLEIPANEFYGKLGFVLIGIERGKRRKLNIWEIRFRN